MADHSNDSMPDWLLAQLISTTVFYFICLLILGIGFFKTLAITAIVFIAILGDFCRKYIIGIGGILLTVVLLEWSGIDQSVVIALAHKLWA